MKKFWLSMLAVMAVGGAVAQDGFTITGSIPGLKAGSKVELVNRDMRDRNQESWHTIDGSVTKDGEFVISGKVDMPVLCEVRISPLTDDEKTLDKAFTLMVENLPISVSAAHIDSVPAGFFIGPSGVYQRRNVVVNGGEAQREYAEYDAVMLPYEAAARQAHAALYWDENRDKSDEGQKRLKEAYDAAETALSHAEEQFITEHPAYHISALKWSQRLSEPFQFTGPELDGLWAKLSQNNSPARVEQLRGKVENARKFVKGVRYTDFPAVDPEGADRKFADMVQPGRYTMVDFWASWCGPCRAAIPHVRKMHEKYGDKLGIIAVSVDEEPAAWQKAMEQEKMTWPQLRVAKEHFKDVTTAYNFSGIPFMVLIDPEGNIVFAGHNPGKVAEILDKGI